MLSTVYAMSDANPNRPARTGAGFPPTAWPPAKDLDKLCLLYWPPVYAFLRRNGHSPEQAEDLTQGFFVHMLQKERLHHVSPEGGRFRTFLLQCLKNYVRNEWKKEHAESRGGRMNFVSIDDPDFQHLLESLISRSQTPEEAYDKQWARTMMNRVIKRVQEEYACAGYAERFEALYPFLADEAERLDYATVAARLKITEGAVRKAAHDLRRRFKEARRAEIGRTVSPAEVNDELCYLSEVSRKR
jgi:RNA polymerase sigma factor (sigma-70 family)